MKSKSSHRIVVGVDGSSASHRALRWAGSEALLRGDDIEIIHAVDLYPVYLGVPSYPSLRVRLPEDLRKAAARTLEEAVKELGTVTDQLVVRSVIAENSPVNALIHESRGADLLVLGSRGHGGFTGLMLGSVAQQCVQHAACPVVVVGPGSGDREQLTEQKAVAGAKA